MARIRGSCIRRPQMGTRRLDDHFPRGPATTDAEDKLLADISGRVFRMQSYSQPALVKLLNNALATYNLAATAPMLNLAAHLGMPAKGLFEVVGVSTGQS